MPNRDYYKILNISPQAKADEIKKAYHDLAKKYHPDINKNNKSAEEKLKKINEAYSVLKNPQKRRAYNQTLKEQSKPQSKTQNQTSIRRSFRRRSIAACMLIFYLLFLSTGLNKQHPFDIQNILAESGKFFSQTFFQTQDTLMKRFISSETGQKLLFTAIKKDLYPLIEFELKNGANPNLIDESGYSLLMRAQSIRTAQLLIKSGADVNYQAPDGYTAYALAFKFDNGLAPLLRQNGARLIWKKEINQSSLKNKQKN